MKLSFKRETIIGSLGLATQMISFIPGSRIGTKIRLSNEKKTHKYPGTQLVLYSTMSL
jgi:hypothetical protein